MEEIEARRKEPQKDYTILGTDVSSECLWLSRWDRTLFTCAAALCGCNIYRNGKTGREAQILLNSPGLCQAGEGYIISHCAAVVRCVCTHRWARDIFVEKGAIWHIQ